MKTPVASPEVHHGRVKAFVLCVVLAAGAPAGAAEPPPGVPQVEAARAPTAADGIARHMAKSQPGPEHRQLDPLAGSWTVELLRREAGGAEAKATGTSENRWILDGRFLLCESAAGQGSSRIDAVTIYGFDNHQSSYFALGLHNLATSVLQLSGSFDRATQSFLLSGKERDELTGNAFVLRQVLRIEGPDRHVVRVYLDIAGRAPVKVLEAVFTRR